MAGDTPPIKNPFELSKSERMIYCREQTSEQIRRTAWDTFLLKNTTIVDDITSIATDAYNLGFNFVLTCARDCLDDKQFKKLAKHVISIKNKLNHDREL